MNVRAIETVYKGYRFRSRLEARWAVFFDECGLDWQYEVEGFELPSGRYLPDFYLPKHGYVEIKPPPAPTIKMPKIYMAGRMGKACYRPFNIQCKDILPWSDVGITKTPTFIRNIGSTKIYYTGPFDYEGMMHGYVHGVVDQSCFGESERKIVSWSLNGIKNCEIFFALFEDLEAFGTLVEIGYAKALGKRIVIGFVTDGLVDFQCDPHNHGGEPDERLNPLWFSGQCGVCLTGTRDSILKSFSTGLADEYPVPREQKIIDELSEASGKGAGVSYGDPVEEMENGWPVLQALDYDYFATKIDWQKLKRAAVLARQARFEFGQSGALTGA